MKIQEITTPQKFWQPSNTWIEVLVNIKKAGVDINQHGDLFFDTQRYEPENFNFNPEDKGGDNIVVSEKYVLRSEVLRNGVIKEFCKLLDNELSPASLTEATLEVTQLIALEGANRDSENYSPSVTIFNNLMEAIGMGKQELL